MFMFLLQSKPTECWTFLLQAGEELRLRRVLAALQGAHQFRIPQDDPRRRQAFRLWRLQPRLLHQEPPQVQLCLTLT